MSKGPRWLIKRNPNMSDTYKSPWVIYSRRLPAKPRHKANHDNCLWVLPELTDISPWKCDCEWCRDLDRKVNLAPIEFTGEIVDGFEIAIDTTWQDDVNLPKSVHKWLETKEVCHG